MFYALLALFSAATAASTRKLLFQMELHKTDGTTDHFEKIYFTSFVQSFSYCCVLCLYFVHYLIHQRQLHHQQTFPNGSAQEALVPKLRPELGENQDHLTWKKFRALWIPGILHFVALSLRGVGLKYTTMSVNTILNGAAVPLTSVLALFVLKQRVNRSQWTGIALVLIGTGVVSYASLIPVDDTETNEQPSKSETLAGIFVTLLSSVAISCQMTTEERRLSQLKLHPFLTCGLEGFHGSVFGLVVLVITNFLPGSDKHHKYENSIHSIQMLLRYRSLDYWMIIYLVTSIVAAASAIMVSKQAGAVFRAMLQTAQVVLVWGGSLALHYFHLGSPSMGEKWYPNSSPVQLVGCFIVVAGTLTYFIAKSSIDQPFVDDDVMTTQTDFSVQDEKESGEISPLLDQLDSDVAYLPVPCTYSIRVSENLVPV